VPLARAHILPRPRACAAFHHCPSYACSNAAKTYLNTQYRWLALWVACLSIIIGSILRRSDYQLAGLWTVLSYITGSALSGLSGYIGTWLHASRGRIGG
jgi:Na+/H+-translocating membrane pyrophosphatase